MKRETSWLKRLIEYIQNHKTKSILVGVGAFFVLFYGLIFFIPKQVQFSYAGDTCVSQLTLFPAIHKATDESKLEVSFRDEMKIGSTPLVSTKTCFTAVNEPHEGTISISTAPFGSIIARKNFSISVPSTPVVSTVNLEKPLPVSKPVDINLSTPDTVFSYKIESDSKIADCRSIESRLTCDVPALKLGQGKKYELVFTRQFEGGAKKTVLRKTIQTLKAVAIKKSSVKNKQTVYSKPTSFTFATDKSIKGADVTLVADEKKPQTVNVTTEVKDKELVVKLSKQLTREKKYKLTVKKLEALDGSTLVEPYILSFTMSGGPKVVGVSVGRAGVSPSAGVVLTFDQKLSEKQNMAQLVNFAGGTASIQKLSDKQILVQLQNLALCRAFSITVKAGLKSAYDITSSQNWRYDARTICHTVQQYGASVHGRPLLAYVFGSSGATTMYVGAIHGNEASSSGILKAWIGELEANPSRIQGKRIVVIPTINPDGVAAGTRTNAHGVNLSRNFPTDNWVSDIDDTDGKHKGGGGKKPLSEPEASALARITQQYRPKLLLSYHAVGSLVVGDPGGYSAHYAAKYASIVGYRDATGAGGTFDYDITGAYEDWTYRSAGIPSMVIELGSYGYYNFPHHRNAMWAMVQ